MNSVKVFFVWTREARYISWMEIILVMKDKVMRFEVLAEDEWQAKLNDMLEKEIDLY